VHIKQNVIYEIKHMYPCFIAVTKYWYEFGAYELIHECVSTSDLITRTRTSTHDLFPR